MRINAGARFLFAMMTFFALNGAAAPAHAQETASDGDDASRNPKGHGITMDTELYELVPQKFYSAKERAAMAANETYYPSTEAEWREYIVEYIVFQQIQAYDIAGRAETLILKMNALGAGLRPRGAADIVWAHTKSGMPDFAMMAIEAQFIQQEALRNGKSAEARARAVDQALFWVVRNAPGIPNVWAISDYATAMLRRYRELVDKFIMPDSR